MEIKKTKVIAVKDPCPIHPSPFKRRYITSGKPTAVVMSPYYRARIKDGSLKYYQEPVKVLGKKIVQNIIMPPIKPIKPEKRKINIPKPARDSGADKPRTGRKRK